MSISPNIQASKAQINRFEAAAGSKTKDGILTKDEIDKAIKSNRLNADDLDMGHEFQKNFDFFDINNDGKLGKYELAENYNLEGGGSPSDGKGINRLA